MEAVAAGDEVAVEALLSAVLAIRDVRLRAVEAVHGDVLGAVDRRQSRGGPGVHEVARELGLAVDQDALAAGQCVQIDSVPLAAGKDLEAGVHETLAMHSRADAGLVEQVDADLLEHPGADAAEHVVGRLPLEHDGIDARSVQELPQQQARRPGSDDRDLGAHVAHSERG